MGRKRLVQSSPVRVSMLTLPPAMRAPVRYPSILISCNHFSPAGAYLASLASCGATKLGGGCIRLEGSGLRFITESKFAVGPGFHISDPRARALSGTSRLRGLHRLSRAGLG